MEAKKSSVSFDTICQYSLVVLCLLVSGSIIIGFVIASIVYPRTTCDAFTVSFSNRTKTNSTNVNIDTRTLVQLNGDIPGEVLVYANSNLTSTLQIEVNFYGREDSLLQVYDYEYVYDADKSTVAINIFKAQNTTEDACLRVDVTLQLPPKISLMVDARFNQLVIQSKQGEFNEMEGIVINGYRIVSPESSSISIRDIKLTNKLFISNLMTSPVNIFHVSAVDITMNTVDPIEPFDASSLSPITLQQIASDIHVQSLSTPIILSQLSWKENQFVYLQSVSGPISASISPYASQDSNFQFGGEFKVTSNSPTDISISSNAFFNVTSKSSTALHGTAGKVEKGNRLNILTSKATVQIQ